MQITTLITITSIAMSSVLVSCSSGDSEAMNNGEVILSGIMLPGSITQFGRLNIQDHVTDSVLDLSGYFYQFEAPVSTEDISIDIARRNLSGDECQVFIGEEFQRIEILPFGDATRIDAGEVITISGTTGTIGEMQLDGGEDISTGPEVPQLLNIEAFYVAEVETPDNISSGLVVDIPGGAFPAFNGISIPDITPFVQTSEYTPTTSFANDYEIGSTFTWEPASDPNSRIVISGSNVAASLGVLTVTEEGLVIIPGTVDLVADIQCVLQDDGSFTLPLNIQNQLAENGFSELSISLRREAYAVRYQGNALLQVIRRSSPPRLSRNSF